MKQEIQTDPADQILDVDQFEPTDGSYPSTMSSPYFTGTLVEEEVEMFSCSGEYIRKGGRSFGGGEERQVRPNEDRMQQKGRGGEAEG